MGKIRIKSIGDEEKEKKQEEEARKRAEAKRAEKKEIDNTESKSESKDNTPTAVSLDAKPKTKSKYASKHTKSKRSITYQKKVTLIDKSKEYSLTEALTLLSKLGQANYDETVELHINTVEKGISGNVTLPHGSGKKTRVVLVNYSEDPKTLEDLIKKIESGVIDFDILIATPDSMPKLARVARILGPKGLMPNPKNGTVTTKPQDIAKQYEGGQVNFKTEAKFPILHMIVGKVSFGESKLSENIKTALNAVQVKNIRNITLKSTMSPGIKLDINSLS